MLEVTSTVTSEADKLLEVRTTSRSRRLEPGPHTGFAGCATNVGAAERVGLTCGHHEMVPCTRNARFCTAAPPEPTFEHLEVFVLRGNAS